ncbi:hypothetical protein AB205_0085030 [Aquarana catesbeiana]|uniref:Uncharacterized protein n=1 Tax=Aquarana catesbeiana TaxID=8400 RepID=A0A2G9Q993_AQUCT|nr:hypothetical protein AB205_0085030 [Aquarana catesbeiana]
MPLVTLTQPNPDRGKEPMKLALYHMTGCVQSQLVPECQQTTCIPITLIPPPIKRICHSPSEDQRNCHSSSEYPSTCHSSPEYPSQSI